MRRLSSSAAARRRPVDAGATTMSRSASAASTRMPRSCPFDGGTQRTRRSPRRHRASDDGDPARRTGGRAASRPVPRARSPPSARPPAAAVPVRPSGVRRASARTGSPYRGSRSADAGRPTGTRGRPAAAATMLAANWSVIGSSRRPGTEQDRLRRRHRARRRARRRWRTAAPGARTSRRTSRAERRRPLRRPGRSGPCCAGWCTSSRRTSVPAVHDLRGGRADELHRRHR